MDIEKMKKMMLEDPAADLRAKDKNSIVTKTKKSFTFSELIKELEDIVPETGFTSSEEETVLSVADLTKESPTIESVDKVKQSLMENMKNHISSVNAHNNSSIHTISQDHILKSLAERMIDQQVAKHFVGIQPMTGPVGLIYLLQYKTEKVNTIGEDQETRLSLEINSAALEASSRKLKLNMEIVAQQDISGTGIPDDRDYGNEIAQEIYEEIRNDICAVAHKETFDMSKNLADDMCITNDVIQTIEFLINRAANRIAQRTRRGAGNFAIVSETIAEILKNSKKFVKTSETDKDYGYVKYLGTWNDMIKIYCDYGLKQDKAIVGYKGGNGEIDAGYFYAPYIPLMTTGVIIDPNTFAPVIKFMSRYGKYVNQKQEVDTTKDGSLTTITKEPCDYYVEITFDNLPKLNKLKIKKEETKEVDLMENVTDAFEVAMEILD